jgi:Leucine-rich repeat (LRR) protein
MTFLIYFLIFIMQVSARTVVLHGGNLGDDGMDGILQSIPDPEDVISLDLRRNRLTMVPDLSRFTKLLVLDLSDNRIETLESYSFNVIQRLERLYISHNQLYFISPDCFWRLTQLVLLDLSHNQLILLPGKIFNGLCHLNHVCLSYNQLSHLPDSLFAITTNLKRLDVSHNRLFPLESRLFSLSIRIDVNCANNKMSTSI